MSMRWSPWARPVSLRDAVNRLYGNLGYGSAMGILVDVEELPDEYIVRASLPGFSPDDVDLTIYKDTLTIRAERSEGQGQYLVRERQTGALTRTVTLPEPVQADEATARFEQGELVITLPKLEERRPRQMHVSVQGHYDLAGGTAPRTPETGEEPREHMGEKQPSPLRKLGEENLRGEVPAQSGQPGGEEQP